MINYKINITYGNDNLNNIMTRILIKEIKNNMLEYSKEQNNEK